MPNIKTIQQKDGTAIQIEFRAFKAPDDEGVIYSPWANQIRKQPPFDRYDPDEFRDYKHRVIEHIVKRCSPVLACYPGEPHQVFGWVCGEDQDGDDVLHFVYVRGFFRNKGIGKALMQLSFPKVGQKDHILYYTHKTAAMRHYVDRWNAKWAPDRVYFQ